MPNEREQFRPVLDKDVMLDILADHVRGLSRKEQESVAKDKSYQQWVKNVATRTFDYGYKTFDLTKKLSEGNQIVEYRLYDTYASLLSELYRESFDCTQFIPSIPVNVTRFLQHSPAAFEPIHVPLADFTVEPNLNLTSDERFFDQRMINTLDILANLIVRALAVKYATCDKLSPVRINSNIRSLVKLTMELISGHQLVLLYGVQHPATQTVKERLLGQFFDQAEKLEVLKYLEDGRMFSDDRFEKDKPAKEAYLLMTGLFDLKPLYLQ